MYMNIHTQKNYGRKIRYSRISVGPVALPAAARCLQFTAGDYDCLFLHPFREEPPKGIVSFGPSKLPADWDWGADHSRQALHQEMLFFEHRGRALGPTPEWPGGWSAQAPSIRCSWASRVHCLALGTGVDLVPILVKVARGRGTGKRSGALAVQRVVESGCRCCSRNPSSRRKSDLAGFQTLYGESEHLSAPIWGPWCQAAQ